MVKERALGSVVFDIVNHVLLGTLSLLCVLPLLNILAVSLSGRAPSEAGAVALWPVQFTGANYQQVITNLQFMRSLTISVVRVGIGVPLTLLMVVLTAYPLAIAEHFPGKTLVKWLLLFAMLFSGGLIPQYLTLRSLGLLDSFWVLVLPRAMPVFYVILMLNYFRGLPPDLAETASIDGASHWQILLHIYLPLSLPSLATITLFTAVGHWNSWFDGLVFILNPRNYPLQSYLQITVILQNVSELASSDPGILSQISSRSLRAAQVMFATVPILLVYPFLQRYFVKGLTLGSVKG